jgi:hypothetical protein
VGVVIVPNIVGVAVGDIDVLVAVGEAVPAGSSVCVGVDVVVAILIVPVGVDV